MLPKLKIRNPKSLSGACGTAADNQRGIDDGFGWRRFAAHDNLEIVADRLCDFRGVLAGAGQVEIFGHFRVVETAQRTSAVDVDAFRGKVSEHADRYRVFAAEYFPGADADRIADAWLTFGKAMDNYPFSIPFLYAGPTNFAFILPMQPAPLTDKLVGRSWLMDERGDNMSNAIFGYTIEEIIAGFEQLTAIWSEGLKVFSDAVANCAHSHAKEELNTATVCYHAFRSTANSCKIYHLRSQWNDSMMPEYRAIISDELENLQAVLPVLQQDSRFGYHIEAHGYQYDALGVAKKIDNLRQQLALI